MGICIPNKNSVKKTLQTQNPSLAQVSNPKPSNNPLHTLIKNSNKLVSNPDPKMAEEYKKKGNLAFKDKKYEKALYFYSLALVRLSRYTNPVVGGP